MLIIYLGLYTLYTKDKKVERGRCFKMHLILPAGEFLVGDVFRVTFMKNTLKLAEAFKDTLNALNCVCGLSY